MLPIDERCFYDKWRKKNEKTVFALLLLDYSDELPKLEQAHKFTTWYPLERQLYCPGKYLFFRRLTHEKLILETSESDFQRWIRHVITAELKRKKFPPICRTRIILTLNFLEFIESTFKTHLSKRKKKNFHDCLTKNWKMIREKKEREKITQFFDGF